MAPHDIFLVEQMFDAFRREDDDAVLSFCHSEAEVAPITEGGRAYRGPDGLRDWLTEMRRAGRRVEPTAHRVVDMGDHVLAIGRVRVLAEGQLTDSPAAWRFDLRDGQFVRVGPA